MDKLDTVEYMTDRYLERYGRALIGIYYLPPLTENWKFPVFMNSLLVTLRRMDLMPCYTWLMDANGGHFLILCSMVISGMIYLMLRRLSSGCGSFKVYYS